MTTTVTIQEAETRLPELLRRVTNGEQIIIAKAGKPIAMLSPIGETPARRVPGNDAGQVEIGPDFDAPLSEMKTLAQEVATHWTSEKSGVELSAEQRR